NVPKAKLAIGVPLYGYDLSTRKPNNGNGFVALKWKEILAAYPNAATSYDPLDTRQLGGYIGLNNKKIYYETPKGAAEKISHTKKFGHQGVIVWELTGDVALSSSNSIMKAINDAAGTQINPPPAVSIIAPANNATFGTGANITISASASDNGSVSKVEFYRGSVKLGEDLTSPYSFTWTNVPDGTYLLTAKATDNQNATASSSPVNITVGNIAPSAAITSPANNATFTTGSTITINATATDSDGTIAKVEFYQGTNKLGEDLSSPYTHNWVNVPAGSYTLTAKAFDNLQASGTSSAINITVGNSNPVTSITAPANNASYTAPASIVISASASDSDGSVARVEFYQGTQKLGEDLASPYSFNWTNVAAGSYALTTKAFDNAGGSGTSATVNVTVTTSGGSCSGVPQYVNGTAYATGAEVQNVNKKFKCAVGGWCSQGGAYEPGVGWAWTDAWTLLGDCTGGNANPTASITSPANNASFAAPASITINATASDTDGTIAKVEFFNGSALLGTDMSAPYSFSWSNVGAGNYSLTAKATDNAGGTGTSAVISVTVTGNTAPTASITAPANNAAFTAPATITISASASDAGGSVTKVEFFQGATKLGEDLSSPYSWSWANVAAGSYSLTAKATDNTGLTGTSSPVNITVTTSGGCNDPQYVENGGYVAGSRVKNAGNSYECKPHPYTGWCNGAAWAYAPGTGTYWQDAWILKGPCTSARLRAEEVSLIDEPELVSAEADGLAVYPNPGKRDVQSITLAFDRKPSHVKLYLRNVNGTQVMYHHFADPSGNTVTVSTPELSPGMYIVQVKTERRSWIRKYLVKE
ncbi:MAG TPA: Ig-like domain-containing protein, partial [Chryseosolibacter sp.]|nr:Ig-like domain-containing protein [Chryseosolibacter sp.]